jgi:hypothetical protein
MNPTVVIRLTAHQMPRQKEVTVRVSNAAAAAAEIPTTRTVPSSRGTSHPDARVRR